MVWWKNKLNWVLTATVLSSYSTAIALTWYTITFLGAIESNPHTADKLLKYGFLITGIETITGIAVVCILVMWIFDKLKLPVWGHLTLGMMAFMFGVDALNNILVLINHPFQIYTFWFLNGLYELCIQIQSIIGGCLV